MTEAVRPVILLCIFQDECVIISAQYNSSTVPPLTSHRWQLDADGRVLGRIVQDSCLQVGGAFRVAVVDHPSSVHEPGLGYVPMA